MKKSLGSSPSGTTVGKTKAVKNREEAFSWIHRMKKKAEQKEGKKSQ